MSTWLKQSTAVEIAMGPFLDETDGKTAETALTITQPDIRLKKNGGAWAQKNAAQTLSHEEAGWYEVALDATDTGTLGLLIVAIHEAGALPVRREFMVVAANVYDSIVGGGDVLDVSLTQVNGAAQTATLDTIKAETASVQSDTNDIQTRIPAALVSGRIDASVGAMAANVMTAAAAAADLTTELQSGLATAAALDLVDNFLDTEIADIQARLPAALTAGGNMKGDALAISGSTESADRLERSTLAIATGTCTTGSSTTSVIVSALSPASAVNDQFKGRIVTFDKDTTTAALRGQATDITAFNHATQTFTVTALTTAPASGDTFTIT